MKKNPNKKVVVDLQFANLDLFDKPKPLDQIDQPSPDIKETKSVRSLTRSNLKVEFGGFKRNPSVAQSHRSSIVNQFNKI